MKPAPSRCCFGSASVLLFVKLACRTAVSDSLIRVNSEFKTKVVKRSSVSTGQLRQLPAVHSQPINLVVFQGTQTRPHLGKGFALRCFQRLSVPYLATLRCHERDNRNTRGTSLQILSY